MNDAHIEDDPVKTTDACEASVLQPVERTLATDKLVDRMEQLQLMHAVRQRKVIIKDPQNPSQNAINNGSEYEGSDEKSPMRRNDIGRLVAKRPQSAKLVQLSNRPDSAKAKSLQTSLKKTSTFLLDALLSSQGCPGPSIQAEALAASWQGQLSCLLRLSVFIWPAWLDEVVSMSAVKFHATSGVVLEMSHQEIVHQLNSLCQTQENSQHKSAGQNDAIVHHMVIVCVKRCSELMRAHDFKSTKQILQKISQLSRRIATTARNQLKLLPIKLIAAMLHVGDGNIRDAVFELRSAIESIPVHQDDVKPFISTDVAILYNHLSYYYSLLGSRAEACKYTKMGIEVMSEHKSTMARSDMSSQYLSVDEVSARHIYIDSVLMMNQVVAEVSNEQADMQAANALCSDAIMFLEQVGTSTTCAASLTKRLQPLFENIQKVLEAKQDAESCSKFPFSSHEPLPGAGVEPAKVVQEIRKLSSKGSNRHSTMSAGSRHVSELSTSTKISSANTKPVKLDLSASFGMVRSQSQISSLRTPKSKMLIPVSTSRPPSAVRSRTVSASPNASSIKRNSKFKMLMLGPALAKGHENYPISSCWVSTGDQDEQSRLPESLIRALFPPSYHPSKFPIENTANPDAHSSDIFYAQSGDDLSFTKASNSKTSATRESKLNMILASEHESIQTCKTGATRIDYESTKNKAHLYSVDQIKIFDLNSLRICCSLIKSLTYSFDSLGEASQQQISLAAHCAVKLACDICYIFKLQGESPCSVCATSILSSGKHVSTDLAQGGIITTQMNRFLQNGVLMRPVAILDDDNFTEAHDNLDRDILPINAEECSIMMGVVPGHSKFNKICGFMIAIRSPPAASFDPEGLLVCELLCNCLSQSLPLL